MMAYQLKIAIIGSKPLIWRRVLIPEKITFSQLHLTIQSAFCWNNSHLYEFEFSEENVRVIASIQTSVKSGESSEIDASEAIDELLSRNKKFKYVYNSGDYWEHAIEVEKVVTDYEERYPQVLKYKGDIIPEDCGSILGYYERLNKQENQNAKEDIKEDIKEDSKLNVYNIKEVNEHLKNNLIFPQTKKNKITSKAKNDDDMNEFMDFMKSVETTNNLFEDSTLADIYACYNKNEIVDIAKRHHVPRYSNLAKKDLITYVSEYILSEEAMKRYFMFMQDAEIEVFEKKINENLVIPIEMAEDCAYLFDGGYCGLTAQFGVIIPAEVADAYRKINKKEFHEKRKRLSLIGAYCHGTNILYGVTPVNVVLELFNQYEKVKLSENELLDAYNEMKLYRCDFTYIDGMFVDDSLMEEEVYQSVYKEQGNRPYYTPGREELLNIEKYNQVAIQDQLCNIYKYLFENMDVEEDVASYASFELTTNIRLGGSTQDVFDDLSKFGVVFESKKQIEEFTSIFNELWNNSRMILNRGYTPNELMGRETPNKQHLTSNKQQNNVIDFSTFKGDKKIYPNDPCPCGSGKKYKKCCGKISANL